MEFNHQDALNARLSSLLGLNRIHSQTGQHLGYLRGEAINLAKCPVPPTVWMRPALRATISTDTNTAEVINHFRTAHPTATLVAQRQTDRANPIFSQHELQSALMEVLTLRQCEVLVVAHAGGYFACPREKTAEELASELDISAPTFAQHLRIAQRKLVSLAFTTPTSET